MNSKVVQDLKKDDRIDDDLVHATVKLNTLLFALVLAFLFGLTMLALTYISLYRTPEGQYSFLNLLAVFLPGYTVSVQGAWIGMLWGAVIGAVSGVVVYRIYARSIYQQVLDFLESPEVDESEFERVTMKISGHPLGLALGSLIAVSLVVATNLLVIRGTAGDSHNAALLSNYLPGYTVSFPGSLIGAAELFVVTYLFCLILSGTYNKVVELMKGKRS